MGAGGGPAAWMLELAELLVLRDLPMGVIVGSAVVDRVTRRPAGADGGPSLYEWHLADVRRAQRLRRPVGHPQRVWFTPF